MRRHVRIRCTGLAGALLTLASAAPAHAKTVAGIWTEKAPMPVAMAESGVAAVGGKLYVVGGTELVGKGPSISASTVNLMYDPTTDRWQQRAPLPVALTHVGVAALDGKLYAIGGFTRDVHMDPVSLAFVYDPKINRWCRIASLSTPRGSVAVAALDGEIHIFGGRKSNRVVKVTLPGGQQMLLGYGTVTTHEIYDPATGKWSRGTPLPGPPRDHMGIAVLDGKIHVFGGRIGDFTDELTRHDVYDPKTDTWTSAAPLPDRRSAGAYTVLDGLIIYAGGECKPGGQPYTPNAFDQVTAYDAKTNRWINLTPLPHARQAFGAGTIRHVGYFAGGALMCGGGASSNLLALALP